MAVSEQTDSLRVLGSDPVDYLITPRTLACMIAGPILNLMCFVMGEPLLPCTWLPSCYVCHTSARIVAGSPSQRIVSSMKLNVGRGIWLGRRNSRLFIPSGLFSLTSQAPMQSVLCERSLCCAAGIACSMMIAQIVYDVPAVIILNSCVRAITAWDLITSMIKAWVFGAIISIVRSPPPCLQGNACASFAIMLHSGRNLCMLNSMSAAYIIWGS